MSGEDPCFLEWKEQFVSQERGNRVVHYYLKDSSGESILAIVGTERSVRHMFYVVSNEFVQAYGSQTSIHAGFKWRSRREVVDWLTSMTSKQCESSKKGSEQAEGSFRVSGRPAIISNGRNSDIAWSGTAWLCGKQLKHYPGFCRNGITIDTYSFVFVMGKGESRYLAYLEDMYEDKRGQKKVKVRWFHQSDEVKSVTPVRNSHPKEVFITSYAQVISVECVDGPATVLNREHYDKCLAAFPHELSSKLHLCFRQFRNNRVKSFDLSKLRGYFDQPVLACLLSSPMLKPESAWNGAILEEGEDMSPSEDVRVGSKRTRSGRGHQKSVTVHSGIKRSGEGLPFLSHESAYKKLKCGLLGMGLRSLKHVETKLCYSPNFGINDKIEVLCQDSGIRGCWFRCTVMQVSRKQMKVQYDDLQDEGGSGNLEEWIPAVRFAMNDKIGMRHPDRLTVRPFPPHVDQNEVALKIGVAVDAWWSDGWWEGVVTGIKSDVDENLQIFFPGENMFKNIERKDLRISRDWVRDQWIDIEAKPEILSAIRADASPDLKLSASSTGAGHVKSEDIFMSASGVDASAKPKSVEEANLNSETCSDGLAENVDPTDRSNKPHHEHDRHDEFETKESHSNIDDRQHGVDNDSENNDLDNQDILDDLQKIADSHVDEVALGSAGDHCKSVEVMGMVA